MQTARPTLPYLSRLTPVKAFTLIELLVVISIIALLIGILLPALGAARHSARVLRCATQMQQLGRSIATYTVDSDGYYPLSSTNTSFDAPYDNYPWDDALAVGGYDGRTTSMIVVPGNASITPVPFELYECPLDNIERQNDAQHPRSYGMSELRFRNDGTITNQYPGISGGVNYASPPKPVSIRVDAVTAGSDAIVLGENLSFDTASGFSQNILGRNTAAEVFAFLHSPVFGAADSISHHKANGGGELTAAPNSETYIPNYLYADGHVASQDAEATFENAVNIGFSNFRNSQWDARPGAN